jgi:uncharacterized protein
MGCEALWLFAGGSERRYEMDSAIYEGWVRHRRFGPVEHAFAYRVYLVCVDLSELPTLFDGQPFWSARGFSLAWFRRSDHLGDSDIPLDQSVRELVYERIGKWPDGPIRLLTHARYFGYCFNPVSFYYCYDASCSRLDATVAEVHNTPWGEEHCYVLDPADEMGKGVWHRHRVTKEFHVSPFMGMDMEYDWRFTEPDETLRVLIANYQGEIKVFEASMSLKRQPMTVSSLTSVLLRYPMMTWKIIAAIYWQAGKLHGKGARLHPHPKALEGKTHV